MSKRKPRKREYGTGSIFRRSGSAKFTIRFRTKTGDIISKTGFESKQEAQVYLDQLQENPTVAKTAPVLSTLVTKWLENRKVTHENHYCDSLRWFKHLEPTVGHLQPDEVTTEVIQNLINVKFQEGLSSGSVGLIVSLLSTIFSDLVETPHASVNPVSKLPKKTKRTLKSDHDPESVPFLKSLEEVGMVFASLPDDLKVPFAVGVYSGLRSGEIWGLEWNNVDLTNRKIRIVQQMTPHGLKLRPKDGESRTTLIPNALALVLENYKIKTGGVGLLFKYVSSGKLNQALSSVLASLGLNANMTWYQSTRHSFASLWVLNGGSIEVLQKLMGHSSILVTMRYSHLKLDTFTQADLSRMDEKALLAA
jgi:integrase